MSTTTNDVATAKQKLFQKFEEYVDNNGNEIYIDYRDELSKEQIDKVLEGKSDEVRCSIEDYASQSMERDDYYWETMAKELDVELEQINEWLDTEGFWPGTWLSDSEWSRLLSNTNVNITVSVDDAEFNFYNWGYSAPIDYADVKGVLKILGVNPYEFRANHTGGSMTAGEGKFRGWFPKLPDRQLKIDPMDLNRNMCALYDGVLNFCIGSLEDVIKVVDSKSAYVTFGKGTNVVMYDFGNGAGICETKLTEDVTIRRDRLDINNDASLRYGIQDCYGFTEEYWNEGSIRNGK